jgi:thiol-disulfide isomerase/thioredoxin
LKLSKPILFLLLFYGALFSCQTSVKTTEPESYKLSVQLENAPFDSLYLQDYTNDRNILITGKKAEKFTWEFDIPQKVVWDSENMVLLGAPPNNKDHSQKMVRFVTGTDEKKVVIVNIGVEGENNFIHGIYSETNKFPDDKLITEDFNLIIADTNADIAIRAKDPFFSWFLDVDEKANTYDSTLSAYIALSKKYPDSRFLISSLSRMLARYKSKSDVEKIYKNFSGIHKNTKWAKNIERFLKDKKFQNSRLPTTDNSIYENIVQDSSKFNLVVFSASWCIPCIEEIPLLKKINKDLGSKLILTNVSLDTAKGVISFKKLIKEKNVPWRSLFAYQEVKKIMSKYFIEGIPYTILVSPNQDIKVINLRNEQELSELYTIINSY